MAHQTLPSIRTRTLTVFTILGLVLSLLVVLAIVSPRWEVALFFISAILLVMIMVGWDIGSLLNQEMGAQHRLEDMSITLKNFMYNVAHTMRTPLNAVRWTVESLKNEDAGSVTEDQRELLDKLEDSSVKLLHLADELQDTLIVVRGTGLHMKLKECSIIPLIDDVAGMLAVVARRRQVGIQWMHPTRALPSVRCDAARIRQVLSVLLDNAVRYARPRTPVRIDLFFIDEKPPDTLIRSLRLPNNVRQSVVVSIRDQGIGISEEDQKQLFQPFFRAENARDIWVDGKGIGMTLARAIIQQSGGSIWLTSRLGRGTTVFFSLPAVF